MVASGSRLAGEGAVHLGAGGWVCAWTGAGDCGDQTRLVKDLEEGGFVKVGERGASGPPSRSARRSPSSMPALNESPAPTVSTRSIGTAGLVVLDAFAYRESALTTPGHHHQRRAAEGEPVAGDVLVTLVRVQPAQVLVADLHNVGQRDQRLDPRSARSASPSNAGRTLGSSEIVTRPRSRSRRMRSSSAASARGQRRGKESRVQAAHADPERWQGRGIPADPEVVRGGAPGEGGNRQACRLPRLGSGVNYHPAGRQVLGDHLPEGVVSETGGQRDRCAEPCQPQRDVRRAASGVRDEGAFFALPDEVDQCFPITANIASTSFPLPA